VTKGHVYTTGVIHAYDTTLSDHEEVDPKSWTSQRKQRLDVNQLHIHLCFVLFTKSRSVRTIDFKTDQYAYSNPRTILSMDVPILSMVLLSVSCSGTKNKD